MNSLGAGLVWSGVQVSLLVVAGGIVYLLLRRRGPAAGSLAALTLLIIAAGLPLIALSPWPHWWRWQRPEATDSVALNGALSGAASGQVDRKAAVNGGDPTVPASNQSLGSSNSSTGPAGATFWVKNFWDGLWDGLTNRPTTATTTSRWPSIAAWLVAAGVSLGLARLCIGLAAVRAYHQRTTAVTDEMLNRLLGALRIRLGCRRQIEIRESPEIVSPATIGWRRPIVLLPAEWRQWTDSERQVVLAHEVAHVARGDFAGWLIAQLSVVLHFYNPLVHWLARRLRVEQELAADALGAMASVGSGPYLTVLASMALRQDDRAATWAARPFLPARGTLLRRIEMLRDNKRLQISAMTNPTRILLCSALVALGLFVAGLRGPGGAMAKAADPPSEDSTEIQRYHAALAGRQAIDLDYVPANAALVAAARPADILKSDAGKLLSRSDNTEWKKLEESLGIPVSEIEYVKYVMGDFRGPAFSSLRIVVRASKPHDWTKFGESIVPEPVAVESTAENANGNWKLFKSGATDKPLHSYGMQNPQLCFLIPDNRTIVFGTEHEMSQVISEIVGLPTHSEWKPMWSDKWQRAAKGEIAVMLDVAKLRMLIEPEVQRNSRGPDAAMITMLSPLWQDTQRLFIGTNMADQKLGLLALADCGSDENAGRVEQTSRALITFALNGLAMANQAGAEGPADLVEIKKTLLGAAEEVLKKAQLKREESTVVVESQGSGASLLAVAGIALPAIQKSRDAARRAQSMNNLRQLALAMHNYHGAHNHLPPAVVMGPDGKTPHSWRIELLPYIEQEPLYQQYKMDEPWDSEANKKVLAQMPLIFHSVSEEPPSTNTDFFVLTGKGTMFAGKEGVKLEEITGGTSNTIMIVEAKRDIPWTKPEDIDYDSSKPLPRFGGHFAGGFLAAFADGSVRIVSEGVGQAALRALIGPSADDKSKLDPNWMEHGAERRSGAAQPIARPPRN
jgi:beta-lactamase regulating signal transducer with metallopeptidase domain